MSEYFDQINNTLYDAAWKSQFLTGLLFPIMNFVGNLGYVAICVLGGYLVVRGTMPVGDIQAFIQYIRSFTQPITQIANISNVLQERLLRQSACSNSWMKLKRFLKLRIPSR